LGSINRINGNYKEIFRVILDTGKNLVRKIGRSRNVREGGIGLGDSGRADRQAGGGSISRANPETTTSPPRLLIVPPPDIFFVPERGSGC
jgi:hypothetical protein